jgi:hypothetical protein
VALEQRGIVVRFPSVKEVYIFPKESRLALRPTQRPIRWVPTVKWRSREADQSSHLVPKIRMCGALPLLPVCVRGVHRDEIIFTLTFTHTSHYLLRLSQRFTLEPKVISKYVCMTEVARE